MTTESDLPVAELPNRLDALLGVRAACACGRVHAVDMARASIRRGALDDLGEVTRDFGSRLGVAVIADGTTQRIAGDRALSLLVRAGHRAHLATVPSEAGLRPHAGEAEVAWTESAIGGADLAIAVGAGTVNDLVKLAAHRLGRPYVCVATAPSMNGFASAIAAITVRGVKRTIDCSQPHAVLADLDILCAAPAELIAAGLGDLESKPTSAADFRLAGLLRGAYACRAPERVVIAAEQRAAAAAEGLHRRDLESIAVLTEALVLSGISMKLAGSSAPASGGEHLISHHWDMTAADEGRVEGWHGAQVGVATIVMAALYEKLRQVDPASIDVDALVARRPPQQRIEQAIRARHGRFADEVLQEYFAKHQDDREYASLLERLRSRWSELWKALEDVRRPPERIREILAAAKAPTTVQELGLTPEHLRRSFIAARELRSRFTVLDLAAELDLLEALKEPVLQVSGALGD